MSVHLPSHGSLSSKTGLADHFERICVLSLPKRIDRRHFLESHLIERGLYGGVEWIEAIDGRNVSAPDGWKSGVGAWGCLLSHLKVLQQASEDGVEHVLVLEDDVVFAPQTLACLPHLLKDLPSDWGQFYLGGQHLADPSSAITPLIWQATNLNRCHAYATSRSALPLVIEHLSQWADYLHKDQWHLDHQLGRAHEDGLWSVYSPSWWLAGQCGGESDITLKPTIQRWWHHSRYALQLPMIHIPDPAALPELELNCLCFDDLQERQAHAQKNALNFAAWSRGLACNALVSGLLPAVAGPVPEHLRSVWPAGVRHWEEVLPSQAMGYPFNHLFSHPLADLLLPSDITYKTNDQH